MVNQIVMEQIVPYGTLQISNENLLRILIGEKGEEKIKDLLSQYSLFEDDGCDETVNVLRIAALPFDELKSKGNLTNLEAARIVAGIELGIRIATAEQFSSKYLVRASLPKHIYDYVAPRLRFKNTEDFVVILLNAKNKIIGCKTISSGCSTGTVVDPKAVFAYALQERSCTSIICVHNHPSGSPSPSQQDIELTKQLAAAGKTLNLPLADHIIVGESDYFSFSNHKMLSI